MNICPYCGSVDPFGGLCLPRWDPMYQPFDEEPCSDCEDAEAAGYLSEEEEEEE